MRIVNSSRDSIEVLISTQRESAKSFGKATVLVEKYITSHLVLMCSRHTGVGTYISGALRSPALESVHQP